MTSHQTTSSSRPQGPFDPLDLDSFVNFDQGYFCATSVSPLPQQPSALRMPVATSANNTLLPSRVQNQTRLPSAPSHQYDSNPQQTGLPIGFMAALNAAPVDHSGLGFGGFDAGFSNTVGNGFDFTARNGSVFGAGTDFDMDLPSPTNETLDDMLFPQRTLSNSSNGQYINPSMMTTTSEAVSPVVQSNVGRMWPGMHQQQAALKAQQEQARINTHHHNASSSSSMSQDSSRDDKIHKLLSNVRSQSIATIPENDMPSPMNSSLLRMRKDEDDMDEDEKLLASEEGKKLSSKERRQLRNKVSARAFRSRRKEYIGQLESEVAAKNNEASDLRMHNRALLEENARLSDLTRMLLSSPAFSTFLDDLSNNSEAVPAPVQRQVELQRQAPKDVNAYAARPQANPVPEANIDFTTLDLNSNWEMPSNGATWGNNQPQVFAVLELPEAPVDVEALSGKSSDLLGFFEAESKDECPSLPEVPALREENEVAPVSVPSIVAVSQPTEESSEVSAETMARFTRICGAVEITRRRLESLLE